MGYYKDRAIEELNAEQQKLSVEAEIESAPIGTQFHTRDNSTMELVRKDAAYAYCGLTLKYEFKIVYAREQIDKRTEGSTHFWHDNGHFMDAVDENGWDIIRRSSQPESNPTVKDSLTTERKKQPICVHCDENKVATEPASDPLWCAECLKEHQDGYAKEAEERMRQIEQKPVCDHCTALALGDSQNYTDADYIRHEDACQFSASERYMLPIAKAQFRKRQEQLRKDILKKARQIEASAELAIEECALSVNTDLVNEERYSRLTGHNFNA